MHDHQGRAVNRMTKRWYPGTILARKGAMPAVDSVELRSHNGFTNMSVSRRAVKLWDLPAEELSAAGDVGLLPWAPLAKHAGPRETIVSRCRARIDREASPPDCQNRRPGLLV